MRRFPRWPKLALSLGALAVLAEAALRAAGLGGAPDFRPDPDLGWAPERRPVLLPKAPGVRRIAVLGDEAATGLSRLGDACGESEVLDFTVPGYGTAQQFVQLQTRVLRYEPDLVLVLFNPANDVRNNAFFLEPRKDRPFFAFDARGRLSLDASFAWSRGFRARSSLRRQVLDRLAVVQFFGQLDDAAAPAGDEAAWRDAHRVTEALLEKSAALVRASGADFAVVRAPEAARQGLGRWLCPGGVAPIGSASGPPHVAALA